VTCYEQDMSESEDDDEDEDDDNENDLEERPYNIALDDKPLNQLHHLLENAANLITLDWKIGYLPSLDIIKCLEQYQPKVKLRVWRAERCVNHKRSSEAELALAKSPQLVSLSMRASWRHCDQVHAVFQMLLALSPNLSFASLVSEPLRGASDWEDEFDPAPWFPKNRQDWEPTSLRHLTLDGWSLSEETCSYWAKFVDIASLESFKCSRGRTDASYFEKASELLPNVKGIQLNLNATQIDENTIAAISDYIAICQPLESLSLWSWHGKVPLSIILNRHTTLLDLSLHEREEAWGPKRRCLELQELRDIQNACPKLRSLTVDVTRTSSKLDLGDYSDLLAELKNFNLDNLTIYLDSGVRYLVNGGSTPIPSTSNNPVKTRLPWVCVGDTEYEDAEPLLLIAPDVDTDPDRPEAFEQPPSTNITICDFTVGFWRAIFGDKSCGPRQLQIKVGETERRNISSLSLGVNPRDIRVRCLAIPHERDDMRGACVIKIDCCGTHKRTYVAEAD
jgi:hypothetical protein